MSLSRREFIRLLGMAGAAGMLPASAFAARKQPGDMYEVPKFGDVRLLHFTDCHAQLQPVYFREPNVNLGIGHAFGKAPHVVGRSFLKHFDIKGDALSHAFTYLDFDEGAHRFGKVGGFAHLATLVKRLRDQVGDGNSLLLDGGDTWQGSGTALWTNGQDMVDACKLLGVDCMTGHWEFTYGAERVTEIVENDLEGHIDFLCQNVVDTEFEDPVFKPYTMKEVNGHRVAVIGQAFPYTPIANPRYKIPDWSFGIRDESAQEVVDKVREEEGAEVVVLLSHNGMDVDLKMASRVSGLDAIFGGHTHDGVPSPTLISNSTGKTLVTNAGSQGKFLGVMDFEVRNKKVSDFQYRLLPVFSNELPADAEMQALVDKIRAPYLDKLNEKLAVADTAMYRRGNFNGTFDQVIVDALMEARSADAAFSPGFRWGTSVLPGDDITFEHVMDQTGLTYPKVTLNEMSGETIHTIMEDVCDNLFNTDPYYQQGGDMVRVGGIDYVLDPRETIGKRITEVHIGGKPLKPKKTYMVAGWASVQEQPDSLDDIWDVVAAHLRGIKEVKLDKVNLPKLKNVKGNPGLADYSGEILS